MMEKYAVFGNPINHSKSPSIHQHFAEQIGKKISYETICSPLDDFATNVHNFFKNGGCGANVTVPFKLAAFELAEFKNNAAQMTKAANTLFIQNDKLIADNTDGIGLVKDLTINNGFNIKDKNILILGAGGAVRGITAALLNESPKLLSIKNRTKIKAEDIVNDFTKLGPIKLYDDNSQEFDLIINATSSSLSNDKLDLHDLPYHQQTICYDLFYSDELTPFLQNAKEQGINQCLDGWGMLVEQAAESFNIWHQIRPQTTYLINNRF